MNHRHISITALALAGSIGEGSAPSGGTTAAPTVEEVRFTDKQATPLSGDVAQAALAYVRNTPEITTSAAGDWNVRAAGHGMDGLQHVRLEQLQDGVKVWGGDIVLHATDDLYEPPDCVEIAAGATFRAMPWTDQIGDAQCACEKCGAAPAGKYRMTVTSCDDGKAYATDTFDVAGR